VDDILASTVGFSSVIYSNGLTCCIGQKKTTLGSTTAAGLLGWGTPASDLIQNNAGSSGQPGPIAAALFGQSLTSSNLISASAGNVITVSGKLSTQPLKIVLNGTTTSASGNPSSSTGSKNFNLVGAATNACSISQIVLINRLLTTDELTKLQTFIGSKQ
jgi:hypothetical protein